MSNTIHINSTKNLLERVEKWGGVMRAFAEGKTVQYRPSPDKEWADTVVPVWNLNCEYRLKPEPETIYVIYNGNGDVYYTGNVEKKAKNMLDDRNENGQWTPYTMKSYTENM